MISKKAVQEFLLQPRDDFTWIKEVDREDLLAEISEFCPEYQFKLPLFLHQLAAFYLGAVHDNFLYFLDMGTGKTGIALNLINLRKKYLKQIKKALVVVPNVVNVENWINETKKFTNLKAIALTGTKAEREYALTQKEDIYLINYDGLPVMMTEFEVQTKGKSKGKKKRVIHRFKSRHFANQFDMVVLDEIHNVKHTTTLTFKLCEILSDHTTYRVGMTGTPIGRDPQGLWSQFYIIDQGETLGTNKMIYFQALFKQMSGYMGRVDWYLPKYNEPTLKQMLLHRSIRYADSECGDLPPIIKTTISINMPRESRAYYHQLLNEAREQAVSTSADGAAQRKNIYAKMRQICSGFVYEGRGEDRVTVNFQENPKLEALDEILDDLPDHCKMIIFHIFNQSGEDIGQLLKKRKVKFATMNNSTTGSKTAEYNKFLTDKKTQVLVVNIMSGGEGLNLQIANYVVFYEPIDRPDVHQQALKRAHRTGQKSHVYTYQFVTKKSVEEKILSFLTEGKCLFDALIAGTASLTDVGGE